MDTESSEITWHILRKTNPKSLNLCALPGLGDTELFQKVLQHPLVSSLGYRQGD